jgi:hypothetical protein
MTRPISVPFPLLVGAVTVALGAGLVFRGASTSPPASTKPDQTLVKEQPPVESSTDPANDPVAPLRRFLGAKAADQCGADDDLRARLKEYHDHDRVESIIATIPHPTKSGLGYWYDLSIDAIARAVESTDLVPYGAFTPSDWPQLTKDKKREMSAPAVRQELPGMLLFRSANVQSKELCIVWLVGETPTSGIEKDAFQKSVELIRKFDLRKHQSDNSETVRILAPFFSGSQQSLLMALEDAKPCTGKVQFIIRNGSATAINEQLFDQNWVNYKTTVIPYKIVRTQVLNYLANPSSPHTDDDKPILPKMAVLRESDTIFGGWGRQIKEKDKTDNDNNEPAKSDGTEIQIPFPIHISGLQGVPNKEEAAALQAVGFPLPQTSGISIPPEEGAREGAARSLAAQRSPVTTAAVNYEIMKNTLTAISHGGVKYVELVATDPRDKILLASLIRERCPDTLMFTTEGDFMLALPDNVSTMHGMVIGTCYPLNAEAETAPPFTLMPSKDTRLIFDNYAFQGCYNAVLTLLDDGSGSLTKWMLGYEPGPADCDMPRGDFPGIWISVIGQNGSFVPVYKVPMTCKLRRDLINEGVFQREAPKSESANSPAVHSAIPHFSTFGLCALCILSGALCWFLFRHLPGYPSFRDSPQGMSCRKQAQRLCLAGMCFIPACLYSWVLALSLSANWFHLGDWSRFALVNRLVLGVCGVMLVVLLGYFFISQFRLGAWGSAFSQGAWATLRAVGEGLTYVLLAAVLVTIFVRTVRSNFLFTDPENQRWYLERFTHFGAGLSPLIPVLLLAACFAAWCFALYRKLDYLDHHSVTNPFKFGPSMAHVYSRLREPGDRLEHALEPYFLRPVRAKSDFGRRANPFVRRLAIVVPLLIVVLVFGQIWSRWTRTIEGWPFDNLMYFGMFFSTLMTVYVAFHFYEVWIRLRELLKEVAKLPLARAFYRLPATVRTIVDGALYANRPGHSALDLSRQQFDLLDQKLPLDRLRQVLPAQEKESLHILVSVLRAGTIPDATTNLSFARINGVEDSLRDAFGACLHLLHFFWQSRTFQQKYAVPTDTAGGAPARSDVAAGAADTADPLQEWIACAEEYVAIVITRYLSQFFAHLRNLLNAMVLCAFLLLLIITLYPFHPGTLMLIYAITLLGADAAVAVWVLVAINRDEVMSHLAGSTPNRFTPDLTFLREIVQYVVPVLGLMMVQFPAVSSFVRSVLDPLLRAVH